MTNKAIIHSDNAPAAIGTYSQAVKVNNTVYLSGQIPLDPVVRQWGDDGTPIVQAEPGHPTARAFTALAESLSLRIARDAFERAGGEKAPETGGPRRLKIMR